MLLSCPHQRAESEGLSYEAHPGLWIASNPEQVRHAFRRRKHHILTCSDPREAPFGTIARPGIGILKTQETIDQIKGFARYQPITTVRSHVQCKACAVFAQKNDIAPDNADQTGVILAKILAESVGGTHEHSMRTPRNNEPVNNLYVDTTMCLGDPMDGGLPNGFKVTQIPCKSWGEFFFGISPDQTYEDVKALLEVVAADVKDDEREPFNVILFRDRDAEEASKELSEKLRWFGRYAKRPWQRYVEAWAPSRSEMNAE